LAEFTSVLLKSPIGIVSYPMLIKPRAALPGSSSGPKFDMNLIIDPAEVGEIWETIVKVARLAFGDMADTMLQDGRLKNPLKNGNTQTRKRADGQPEQDPLYAGKWFITPRGEKQPLILGADGATVISPEAIYSGCYARALVSVFAFPKPGKSVPNKGVSLGLEAIQFIRDGQRIGGGPLTAETAAAAFGAAPGAAAPAPAGYGAAPGVAPAGYGAAPGAAAPAGFGAPAAAPAVPAGAPMAPGAVSGLPPLTPR
jgi:hypothetical protein